ncbi:MAG: ABC transporter permease [Planctomycetota bacterium]|jgi:ABC-type antimicrobial peptide transport system permease subunit|nr:ABC transporter permease [Planctomycetota bacterium]MDP6939199.1 ABC transporter permease [Planctomycetota bacterium]
MGSHIFTGMGIVLAGAVLTGALLVGDSVRGTLEARGLVRIAGADAVLSTREREFRADLAQELAGHLMDVQLAPAWRMVGQGRSESAGLGGVQVIGCDARMGALAHKPWPQPEPGEAFVSMSLAQELGLKEGDELRVRVPAPSALSLDLALTPADESTVGLRMKVGRILLAAEWSEFSLYSSSEPVHNAFVNLTWLQDELQREGAANLLLASGQAGQASAQVQAQCNEALARAWRWSDAQIQVVRSDGWTELSTERVFLDAIIEETARSLTRPSLGILTYFVNSISGPIRTCPYSTVAAVGALVGPVPELEAQALSGDPGEISISTWLEQNQALIPGDEVQLTYFVPAAGRGLMERSASFTVGSCVPHAGLAADPSLMPEFPGLEGEENCRDWEPGIPIDLDRIRDVDERYWDERRGTPKAFISLEEGQAVWANPYGTLTGIRASDPQGDYAELLHDALKPARLGLDFQDLRSPVLAAAHSPTDFGGLFLGLSFFLLAAALGLVVLLVTFGIERRSREVGLLLAVGFTHRRIRRLLVGETCLVALDSSICGALLGWFYQGGILELLAGRWSGAVAGQALEDHGRWATVGMGAGITWVVAVLACWIASRGLGNYEARTLLASGEEAPPEGVATPSPPALWLGLVFSALAVAMVMTGSGSPGSFFGAGSCLLVAGIAWGRLLMTRRRRSLARSVTTLGWRAVGRRPGRSLTVVALLAIGSFLVFSMGANVKGQRVDGTDPASGTGGFSHFAQSALPLFNDPTTESGQDAYALMPADVEGLQLTALRMGEGDEASCLNLGAPQQPRLVGVGADGLARRGSFTFVDSLLSDSSPDNPWTLLNDWSPGEPVPAVGDAASITWSLKSAVGESLEVTDAHGGAVEVRIVGAVQDSILQGMLLIPEEAFVHHFPGSGGYRGWLMELDPAREASVIASLEKALAPEGFEVEASVQRLGRFRAVQDTYLRVFQVLGGLGLLLGSIGLALVLLRNAHERRHEWRVLSALGLGPRALRRMLVVEHGGLALLGIAVGVVAALLALVPTGLDGDKLAQLVPWLGVLVVNAGFWILAGARWANLNARRRP